MNDLVKRLRCYADADNAVWHPWVYRESADRIEAQASRIERQDARITELKAEAKLWWDENFKKQTACEQMATRIAELEAALERIAAAGGLFAEPASGQHAREIARAALAGGKS